MEIVELRVQVEDSQLKKLQADVQALKGTTINLGAGGSGSRKSSDPTASVRAGMIATEKQAQKTGQSVLSVMGKVAKWTAVTTAVYAPIRAFKEALTTIKALDTEMVNIQKVTGASAQQMKQFQEQSYALASQYGRSAMDVAESMTAFARAGYGDNLANMAELSTLMQNVGYVSADTANSMLLAVDAAWHLNGSQSELMKVMDGVDKITNQNATDFGKMAEGMTVAASVFAESGESIQTFASMVGTGTAVTQRSGSEIARGLRTIMMNIRQIRGETEDGELIDGESIANASKALKEFAGINTMENGELRKASDILSDLAAKWEDLDSVQQSAVAEALAGKRQANILTALMGNWDMYEKQMEEYATAAGTALKENEIYMDSWAAKSEQLSSKWTEFVSHFVETDVIKGALDGLIGALEFLDSDMGQLVIKTTMFGTALAGISKGILALSGTAVFKDIAAFVSLLSTEGLAAFGALSATLTPLMAIAALGADFAFMAKAVDDAYVNLDEQKAVVSDLKTQYEQLTGAGSEYAQLMEKVNSSDSGASALTERERNRLTVLNAQADALERQIEIEERLAFQKFQQQEAGTFQLEHGQMVDTGVGEKGNVKRLKEMNKLYEEGIKKVQAGETSLSDYRATLQDIIADNTDWYNQMKEWEDLGFGDQFEEADKEAMALYETISQLLSLDDKDLPIVSALNQFEEKGVGFTQFANETVVNASKLRQTFADLGYSAEDAQAAIDGLRADGVIVIDVENDGVDTTLSQLEDLGIAVKDADGWKINIDSLDSLANELGLSADQADALAVALDSVDGVSLVDAQGNAVSLLDTMTELGMKSPMELLVSSNTDQADSGLASVEEKAEEVDNSDPNVNVTATDNASGTIAKPTTAARLFGDMRPNPTLSATDNASSVIGRAVSALKGFVSKSITLTATYVTSGKGPGGGGWGSGSAGLGPKATGDVNFKGGPVLLGDEYSPSGAPRPELVITKNGQAFLAGMAGPVATTLPPGARIFKYSDTLDVLSGRDMTQISAFAGGDGLGGLSLGDRYLRGANGGGAGGGGNASNGNASGGNASGGNASGGNKAKASGGNGNKSGGSSSSSSSSGSSKEDSYLKQLQDELEVLRAQYNFLEASGAATDDLVGKSKEIQGKLHEINDRLRATGGSQKDIYSNSADWYNELENIHKVVAELYEKERSILESRAELMRENSTDDRTRIANLKKILENLHDQAEYMRSYGASEEEVLELSIQWWNVHKDILDVYEDEKNLLESQVDLMEKQSAPAADRIGKLRLIQQNLHQQAEYMRKIGARQEEINQKSIEWWEIQNRILQIQQDLMDELDAAINHQLTQARKARDDELKVIDEQIKKLQEERDIQEEQLSIEERRKQVEEARLALENAKNQRTVRYYNAATGQWEWGADANNVKSAQEAYDRAKKDYEQDQKDRAYDAQIKALELQRDEINNRYDLLESRWEALSDSFAEPLRNINDILGDLLATGKLTDDQITIIKSLVGDIGAYMLSISNALASFDEYKNAMAGGTPQEYIQYMKGWMDENGWTSENKDTAWDVVNQSGSGEVAARFAVEYINQAASQAGVSSTNDPSTAPAEVQSAAAAAAAYAASVSGGGNTSSSWSGNSIRDRVVNSVSNSTGVPTSTINSVLRKYGIYDGGGVLSGLGGIKGTAEDEIVIPPDVAKFMLHPNADHQFKARMAELGYLYGANNRVPSLTGIGSNRSSNDHYGDVYQYGNITLSEGEARSMTVYELAQKARGLSVYSAG